MREWIDRRLNRKITAGVVAVLLVVSTVFLTMIVGLYKAQLEEERSRASEQVNRLLQASLENAMLKRDLPGLRTIVKRLGELDGISGAMILNPRGEIRFADHDEMLGRRFDATSAPTCTGCHRKGERSDAFTLFMTNERGQEVLRSVNPVRNREVCVGCHGPVAKNPINGILFIDFAAENIRNQAIYSTMLLSTAGGFVIVLTALAIWLLMHRIVLIRLSSLADASQSFSEGRLDVRVAAKGGDEIAHLGRAFNDMASRLSAMVAELREKDVFQQSLIDANPDGIRVIGEDFTIIQVNQSYCDQLGIHPDEALGVPCYRSSHGRDAPCPPTVSTCPVTQIAQTDAPLTMIDDHVRGDGSDMRVEVSAAPLRVSKDGQQRTWVVEAIRDLGRELELSQEHRLSDIGRLATGVAHEVYNPLMSVRMGLRSILRIAGPRETEEGWSEIITYLKTVETEIDDCVDVTKRLLSLSFPPSENAELVDIKGIIRDVISLLEYEARKTGVRIEIDFEKGPCRVIATDSEVRTIVLNILQNAFHAMPDGGCLEIYCRLTDRRIVFSVTDSGLGVDPADQPYLFDPFFSRRANGVKGTGLGLSICKAIAERYDGNIELRSKVGQETQVTVSFPSADD